MAGSPEAAPVRRILIVCAAIVQPVGITFQKDSGRHTARIMVRNKRTCEQLQATREGVKEAET